MRNRWIPALVALAALLVPAAAAAERPIVYAVVVDGLDGDRVDAGRAPFLASLLAGQNGRATYYRESRSVMIAETNPNHTAMMTGAYGATSGIPGNAFAIYAPLENEDTCVATGPIDERSLPTQTSGEQESCPLAETVFAAVKRQGNPDDLVTAAIFGKPKLGRIFAGRRVDPSRRDVDYLWAPCASGADDDDYCGSVPTQPATGYAIDDRTVMDEVLRTVRQGVEVRGQTRRPDFTFVNLHQVDSAGHAVGTDSGAYDAAILQADSELQRLVSELRVRGEWERTVLIVLSDHSMDTTLEKTSMQDAFSGAGIPESDFKVVQNGSVDMVYLADRTSPARFDLLKRMRATALADPQVTEALYREPNPADGGAANTIDGVHPEWHAAGPRTGDLFIVHRPGGAFSDPTVIDNPIVGNHGGPQTRDNFFAVIGGGQAVRQQSLAGTAAPGFDDTGQSPGQAENVDVAPTVMRLFGLAAPRDNSGRFLEEAFELPRVPGGGATAVRPARARLSVRSVRPRRCASIVRYRVRWAPAGQRFDVQIRTGRTYRDLLTNTDRRALTYPVRRGRRVSFRVRAVTPSGTRGEFSGRSVRPQRVRCAGRAGQTPTFTGRAR